MPLVILTRILLLYRMSAGGGAGGAGRWGWGRLAESERGRIKCKSCINISFLTVMVLLRLCNRTPLFDRIAPSGIWQRSLNNFLSGGSDKECKFGIVPDRREHRDADADVLTHT